MKRIGWLILAVVLVAVSFARAADVDPKTDEEKTLYALGLAISTNLNQFRLTAAELELVKAGLTDGVLNRTKKVDGEEFRPKVQALAEQRISAGVEDAKKAGKARLDKAVAEEGATRKASGLVFKSVQEGTGKSPVATDSVKVHYTGTLLDGTEFDSSVRRGTPATFRLDGVIGCWTEGLQLMKEGGKAKLYCPSDIAYGDKGRPKIPPGATLIFDVELLEIVKPAAEPAKD